MKKMVIILSLIAYAGSAFATDVIEMKRGIKFNHKAHQEKLGGACNKCHEKGPGKIEGFGKDFAHKSCKGCHAEMKKGPISCKGCHKP
ncbi:MAG: cytochrome c3 family protein [Desulfuromonadaceae bacterium]|nr:cytochrome c3 family protein [Desulfuromonadaceae bacterium]